tara:strand:- start:331 stop:822 length:492 start_codon:yes stop_codon:yes gene_type:complete
MNYSIESKIELKRSQKKVWELISTPGILESVHPFCKENKVLLWKDNNEKQDLLVYLNDLEYYREFKKWDAPNGFELYIGKKDGKKSKVIWQIKKNREHSELKITVFPYRSNKIPRIFYFWVHYFYIKPKLKNYLSSVLNGINWYLDNKIKVKRNQFGPHPWFS